MLYTRSDSRTRSSAGAPLLSEPLATKKSGDLSHLSRGGESFKTLRRRTTLALHSYADMVRRALISSNAPLQAQCKTRWDKSCDLRSRRMGAGAVSSQQLWRLSRPWLQVGQASLRNAEASSLLAYAKVRVLFGLTSGRWSFAAQGGGGHRPRSRCRSR